MEHTEIEQIEPKSNEGYTCTARGEYNLMKHESRTGKVQYLSSAEERLASILAMRPPNRQKELLQFLVSNALKGDSPQNGGLKRAIGF